MPCYPELKCQWQKMKNICRDQIEQKIEDQSEGKTKEIPFKTVETATTLTTLKKITSNSTTPLAAAASRRIKMEHKERERIGYLRATSPTTATAAAATTERRWKLHLKLKRIDVKSNTITRNGISEIITIISHKIENNDHECRLGHLQQQYTASIISTSVIATSIIIPTTTTMAATVTTRVSTASFFKNAFSGWILFHGMHKVAF